MDYVIKTLRFGDMLLVRYRLCPFPTDGLMRIYPYSASLEKQFKESEPEIHIQLADVPRYPYGSDNELRICLWCDANRIPITEFFSTIPITEFFSALDEFMCHEENRPRVMAWLKTLPPAPEAYRK